MLAAGLLLVACGDSGEPSAQEPLSESEQLLRDGQRQARMCLGCHGPRGVSRVASYPSLAGLSEDYLAEQLRAYRSQERSDPTMTSIARSLSDDDIAALSHYYASQPAP